MSGSHGVLGYSELGGDVGGVGRAVGSVQLGGYGGVFEEVEVGGAGVGGVEEEYGLLEGEEGGGEVSLLDVYITIWV